MHAPSAYSKLKYGEASSPYIQHKDSLPRYQPRVVKQGQMQSTTHMLATIPSSTLDLMKERNITILFFISITVFFLKLIKLSFPHKRERRKQEDAEMSHAPF